MDETEVQFVCEDLHACRVCLATDVRLEALYPGRLAETYEQLTGTPVSPTDGLPQHLCSMCAALLKKSAAFRKKCLNTLVFLQMLCGQLQSLGPLSSETEITMPLIRNLDRKYFKLPYVTSDMLTVSSPGVSSNTITNEIPVIELNEEESEEDCVLDCESPVEQFKQEILIDLKTTETINPIKSNAKAYDVLEIKESSCKDECDMFDWDTESNTVHNLFNSVVSVNRNTVTDNTKLNKNMFSNRKKTVPKTRLKSADSKRQGVGRLRTKEALDEFGNTYNFDVIIMTINEQISQLEQSRKKCLSYRQGRFKCEECFRGFKSETTYKNHMTVHDPASGSHVCEVCKHRYPTVVKLKAHKLQHRLKFICRQCQKRFKDSTSAREHYRAHTGVRYECQHCGATFRRYGSRFNHIRVHHGATACDICYEGLNGASGILQHKALAHKKTYQCASCDVHFDNAHAMTRHIGSSPDGACDPNIRACAKCGEPCASGEQLDAHVARAHVGRPRPPRGRPRPPRGRPVRSATAKRHRLQRDTTQSCKRERKKRVYIERKCCGCSHFEIGKNEDGESVVPNSWSCPCGSEEVECVCQLGSVLSCKDRSPSDVGGGLRKHRTHRGCCHEQRVNRAKVMCEVCGATRQPGAALREHQRIHTGEKPFECSECHKRFRLKKSLRIHMNSHTGERPFKCSLCPKAYTTPTNLDTHVQRLHSEARPHSCEACGKTFKTSTERNYHVRTVHMKIPQPRRVRSRKRKTECTNVVNERMESV